MRIIFAGTPPFAAAHLKSLLSSNKYEIVAIYTQPDRKAGRGKKLQASPVKVLGQEANIPVEQPSSLKNVDEQEKLKNYNADLMVVVAYGMLLPEAVLNIPVKGCINVHASILPRWRGAAPIERAIIENDETTGVTIMQMDVGLDTGDMLSKAICNIDNNETGDSLREKLISLGTPALLSVIDDIDKNNTSPEKQDDSKANYANKLLKQEGEINWRDSAENIARKIRALTSALPSFTWLDGERVKIVTANASKEQPTTSFKPGEIIDIHKGKILIGTSNNLLEVTRLQLSGGKAMDVADLLNGKPDILKPGMIFKNENTGQQNT